MAMPDVIHPTLMAASTRNLASSVQDNYLTIGNTDPPWRLPWALWGQLHRVVERILSISRFGAVDAARRVSRSRAMLTACCIYVIATIVDKDG